MKMADRTFYIALVEDDPIMGESLLERLELEGFGVDWFQSFQQAEHGLARKSYNAIISDIRLPDGNGANILSLVKKKSGGTVPPTIFVTAYGTIDQAVSLLKQGATDYLTKPLDTGQLLERLAAYRRDTAKTVEPESATWALGVSAAMRDIESQLVRLVEHPYVPILFSGESGVGKEVAARFLHDQQCPATPFAAINCAAIPDTLISSELFGHEKGAFTGAERRHAGLFERAGRGFALLDEVGDMSLSLQPVLLRVLQERRFTRLGGKSALEIEGRVLFATHQNLKDLVRAEKFREDLFYRINVVHIEIPPLRERREDIGWLADRFLHKFNLGNTTAPRSLSVDARDYVSRKDWQGNARELKNALQRAYIFSKNEVLQIEDFGNQPDLLPEEMASGLNNYLQHDEREYIVHVLRAHGLRIAESATVLEISRKTLWQKMKKYGIVRDEL
jgi:DNA-binding NtrC family response regulator